MSTTPNPSFQFSVVDGTPLRDVVSREPLLDLALGAYKRAGTHLTRDDVDIELAEVADKAACSLLRDRWNENFPIAAYVELLTTVAAFRAALGFDPTPTAPEVFQWAEDLGRQLGSEIDGPTAQSLVRFVNGPYSGAILRVPGATEKGPAETLTLPIAWGDTADPGRGKAQYRRAPAVNDECLWLYRLDDEAVRDDARPHITAPAPTAPVGA
ncbi:hypothetical protein [Streptomyces niveus]|uniref:hypothetical protein n=1 Tax=Streptomyces niveus TaxID=193462 RepID=UPI00342E606D